MWNMEQTELELERLMSGINPDASLENRKYYLAGVLDAWEKEKQISKRTHDKLVPLYAF